MAKIGALLILFVFVFAASVAGQMNPAFFWEEINDGSTISPQDDSAISPQGGNLILTSKSQVDSPLPWKHYVLPENYSLEKIFGDYWVDVLRFNRIDRNHLWSGKKIKAPLNIEDVKNFTPLPKFYELAKYCEKYVLISLDDQFLGCYEFGELKFSFPIASGKKGFLTPCGDFKVLARHRDHKSDRYTITGTDIPYPMTWAVKFHISKSGRGFWIHGRDLPGYPASHGCIGLYDEEMQKKYYGSPKNPILIDAKKFYLWLFPDAENDGGYRNIQNGAPVRIVNPVRKGRSFKPR